ncbi:hypothetical protein bcgnr5369_68230 [Bacillus cereus]
MTEAGKLLFDKGKFIMQQFDDVYNEIFELKSGELGFKIITSYPSDK